MPRRRSTPHAKDARARPAHRLQTRQSGTKGQWSSPASFNHRQVGCSELGRAVTLVVLLAAALAAALSRIPALAPLTTSVIQGLAGVTFVFSATGTNQSEHGIHAADAANRYWVKEPWGDREAWDAQKTEVEGGVQLSLWQVPRKAWRALARVQVSLVHRPPPNGRPRLLRFPSAKRLRDAFEVEQIDRAWAAADALPGTSNNPVLIGTAHTSDADRSGADEATSTEASRCVALLAAERKRSRNAGDGVASGDVWVARLRDVFVAFEGIVFDERRGISALQKQPTLEAAYWPTFENLFGVAGAFYDSVLAAAANPHRGRDADETDAIKWELDYFWPRTSLGSVGSGCGVPHGDPLAPCNSGQGAVVASPRLLVAAPFYGLNYFHFVAESGLPQLLAFKAAGFLSSSMYTLLVYDKPFVRQALRMLGIPTDPADAHTHADANANNVDAHAPRLVYMEPGEVHFAHEVYFLDGLDAGPSIPASQGTLRATRLRMLTLLPPLPPAAVAAEEQRRRKKIVYVRRDVGAERSIANEAQLLDFLRSDEFAPSALSEVHIFEADTKGNTSMLSIKQQMQLFRDADLVVGAHGAALTNVLWMQKESARVLYFGPQLAQETMGGTLGDLALYRCGANDFWLLAAAAAVRFYASTAEGDHNHPVRVDVARLRRFALQTGGILF